MKIPQSRSYIRSNPRFALTRDSRPNLHEGQMTILYDALEQRPREHSLEDLVSLCSMRGYESTFTNPRTDIRKSILSTESSSEWVGHCATKLDQDRTTKIKSTEDIAPSREITIRCRSPVQGVGCDDLTQFLRASSSRDNCSSCTRDRPTYRHPPSLHE